MSRSAESALRRLWASLYSDGAIRSFELRTTDSADTVRERLARRLALKPELAS